MRTVYIKVLGKVQGVFFRATTQKQAINLNIKGWVKNTEDFVEITASGENTNIERLIQWAHKGPERAKVEKVEVKEIPFEDFNSFQMIRR